MSDSDRYLFVVCQVGAENVLKAELHRQWPALRLSYSRPGLVTFKWVGEDDFQDDLDLRSVFARTYGVSLGRVVGQRAEDLAGQVWQLAGEQAYNHLHVWQRDTGLPGERGFEPGVSALAVEVASQIMAARPSPSEKRPELPVNHRARPGERILDCVVVEPGEWLVGQHRAIAVPSRFPGGVCVQHETRDVVSRAYWKMKEAARLVAIAGRSRRSLRRNRQLTRGGRPGSVVGRTRRAGDRSGGDGRTAARASSIHPRPQACVRPETA